MANNNGKTQSKKLLDIGFLLKRNINKQNINYIKELASENKLSILYLDEFNSVGQMFV